MEQATFISMIESEETRNLILHFLQAKKIKVVTDLIFEESDGTIKSFIEYCKKNQIWSNELTEYLKRYSSEPTIAELIESIGKSETKNLVQLMLENNEFKLAEKLLHVESLEAQEKYKKLRRHFPQWGTIDSDKKKRSRNDSDSALPDDLRDYVSDGYSSDEDPTTWSPKVKEDFFDKFPDVVNILILGETGVGKSTFINGLVNYLKYNNLHEAKDKLEILIRTCFYHTNSDYTNRRIECEPTIKLKKGEADNERTETGKSSTKAPRAYLFSLGNYSKAKKIRIIDTPGIGDINGIEQEKKNFGAILDHISELHAICILMKPNESKLTLTFKFCLAELLTKLHKTASQNILFCLTNSRQTLYKPGETYHTLEAYLNVLKKKCGTSIPLKNSRIFCFDNESFRFLCAWREGENFSAEDFKNFNFSWQHTVTETFRLFNYISQLTPHKVKETLSVNNIRSVIQAMTRPLADIAENQATNIRLIEQKIEEVSIALKKGENLKEILYVDQIDLIPEELPYPTTVCSSESCIDYLPISKQNNSPLQTIYKTVCHDNCSVEGIKATVFPNTELKKCWIFEKDENKCRSCGCPWNTHLHITYKINKKMKKVQDAKIQEMLENDEDFVKVAERFIQVEKERKEKLEQNAIAIRKKCAAFTTYLKHNSLIPYNDVYMECLKYLIKEQKNVVKKGGDEIIFQRLNCYKDDYEKQLKAINDAKFEHKSEENRDITIEGMNRMVNELKKMETEGKVLVEIQNLEMRSTRKLNEENAVKINVEKGWLANFSSAWYYRLKNFFQ